jgi:type IV secretory pathway TrbD component
MAQVERHGALRWRCSVCGGPVVPTDPDVPRSNRELASLIGAQRARAMAVGWTAAAMLFCAIAVVVLGFVPLLWLVSHGAAAIFAALGGIAAFISAESARRAARCNAEARTKLEDAWERVAREVIEGRGAEVTAPELARVMRTDDDHAETLLMRLSAGGRVRVAVRDDAELAYRGADQDAAEPVETARVPGRRE